MNIVFAGNYRFKNPVTGKKVYSPVVREMGGPSRRSRRWFLRAHEANVYGVKWALRATRQLKRAKAE